MAREGGGGGGAFGWTILGILVGVAGTLAVETLLHNHHATEANTGAESSVSASVAIEPVAPQSVAVPLVREQPANVAAVSSAPPPRQLTQSEQDVQDDAAATGMTSRSHATSDNGQQPVPGGGN